MGSDVVIVTTSPNAGNEIKDVPLLEFGGIETVVDSPLLSDAVKVSVSTWPLYRSTKKFVMGCGNVIVSVFGVVPVPQQKKLV